MSAVTTTPIIQTRTSITKDPCYIFQNRVRELTRMPPTTITRLCFELKKKKTIDEWEDKAIMRFMFAWQLRQ
jgi:hypothetical protein